jgi:hypothetical protein
MADPGVVRWFESLGVIKAADCDIYARREVGVQIGKRCPARPTEGADDLGRRAEFDRFPGDEGKAVCGKGHPPDGWRPGCLSASPAVAKSTARGLTLGSIPNRATQASAFNKHLTHREPPVSLKVTSLRCLTSRVLPRLRYHRSLQHNTRPHSQDFPPSNNLHRRMTSY